ncbi:NAD(P)H-binding protein [Pragia fontium]|uniref:NAD(P)H-binding n=1 Tax=Pragia fontium DSM 5563 = ATCC 49100 TaxID=1122977 RepID=A0AAJ4W7U3_9GAMM|nr:NAD(P)H-binding protein [Pragia fontium]SFC04684.1 NAD(P)H-binding [Pragia fontium DSM 5563 = ATCC 49100]
MPTTALLLGASGLIGSQLLNMLQSDPRITHIYAPSRHPLANIGDKVINPVGSDVQILLDTLTEPVDVVFCCLGTTQKTAGSREAFRFADITLPVHGGKTARRLGASHYLVVSALGANAKSWVFYNKTKGQMEQALIAQNWPHLTIARPSMLIGKRDTPRTPELLAAPLFHLLPGKWKAIPARDVAYVLWQEAFSPSASSVDIIESDQLRKKASSL